MCCLFLGVFVLGTTASCGPRDHSPQKDGAVDATVPPDTPISPDVDEQEDSGHHSGSDAGPDAGPDGGVDAGPDGGVDAGWPTNHRSFGYYWGMGDAPTAFSSVAGTVDTMFVNHGWETSDIQELVDKETADLNTLAAANAKGIINAFSVFFDPSNDFALRADWESRWNQYWALMYAAGNLPKIAAFYPLDEPNAHISDVVLSQVAHIIKINVDTTPYDIPVMITLTASGVLMVDNGTYVIPDTVRWLGFDEYHCWDTDCFQGIGISEKLQMLRNVMDPVGGSVFVVLQGFSPTPNASAAFQQMLIDRSLQYRDLCQSYADCTGVFVFLLNTNANLDLYAVDDMPLVQTHLLDLGPQIMMQPL